MAKELKNINNLQTWDFVENAHGIKFSVEKTDEFILLTELDIHGVVVVDAKRRRFTHLSFDGLLNNRHFSKTSTGRRIYHGEIETTLEFNKLVPK